MPSLIVEIGFSATLGHDLIPDCVVEPSGRTPRVRIQSVDPAQGLHRFYIEKRIPHHHPNVIVAVKSEAERQIDVFWHVLSYLLDCPIRPTGEVQYLYEGQSHCISPPISPPSGAAIKRKVGAAWFSERAVMLSRDYDIDLLKRFNFARFLEDPVSRYLSLYTLLASALGDRQRDVDKALLDVDPTIEIAIAAGRNSRETTFTRLRNEIVHHREDASMTETHREIVVQVERFTWLVGEALSKRLRREI
jgi:hypothetical protein